MKGHFSLSHRYILIGHEYRSASEKPSFEVPEMENLLDKCRLIHFRGKVFQFNACLFDFPVLRFVKTTICDKMPYFFDLPCVKPHAVSTAFVDDHARDTPEVLPVHKFPASDTGNVLQWFSYRSTDKLAFYFFLTVYIRRPRCLLKFTSVKPDSAALRANIIFIIVMHLNFERNAAMRTDRENDLDLVMKLSTTERTDCIPLIDSLPAVLALLCIILAHFAPFFSLFPARNRYFFCLLYQLPPLLDHHHTPEEDKIDIIKYATAIS